MAWTDYRLTDPENGALISEWHFGEGSGTTVADEVGSSDIDLTTPTDPNYTWETEGISLASGLIQTPSITGARTVVLLCRTGKGENGGFLISGGLSSGYGTFPQTVDPSVFPKFHTGSVRGVVPIYRRDSNGQVAYRVNRGNWVVVFAEYSQAYNTIFGWGGRHSTTTSRLADFGIAWAAVFDNVLTDAERQRIYFMARQLAASRSFYIDYRDCPSTAKLVGVWGQSNAEGRAKIANLSAGDQLKTTPANVYISSRDTLTTAALVMGTNNQTDAPATDFGPEMGLAWEAEDASQTLYISKYGVGSSYLANTGANDWSLDDEASANKFNLAMRNLWTVEADMLNAGIGPDLAGVLWMQGEQDATSAAYGAEYGENLRPLIEKYREQMGDASAKFCVARIREEDPAFDASGVADVRKYQEVVGSMDAATSWIDTDAMTLKVDDVHYDAAGMKALGEAAYAALLAGEETPTYANASDVRFGVDRGDGTTGTCYVPTAAQVLSGVNVDATTGTVVLPSAASVLDSVSYGPASGTTGTYHAPEASEVINTASFGDGSSVDGTAPVLDDVLTALGNVPSATQNAAAVWNAATDDHNTAGSFGANLDVAVSSVSGGGGSIPSTFSAIVFTFDDDETEDPVSNVAIEINGYALQISGIDGVARIYVPNNATYTVRIIPPYGYSIPTPIEVTVVEDDVPRAVSLEKVTAPALSEEDDCECTLQVVTAHNVPITGAKMVAATASEATFTTESLVFPTTVTAESESGVILINLIQGVTYDISVTYEGRAVRTQITVPASGTANIATLVV